MKTNLAEYIKSLRKALGLTQSELAAILKIQRYNISKYENGITIPPGDVLLKMIEIGKEA